MHFQLIVSVFCLSNWFAISLPPSLGHHEVPKWYSIDQRKSSSFWTPHITNRRGKAPLCEQSEFPSRMFNEYFQTVCLWTYKLRWKIRLLKLLLWIELNVFIYHLCTSAKLGLLSPLFHLIILGTVFVVLKNPFSACIIFSKHSKITKSVLLVLFGNTRYACQNLAIHVLLLSYTSFIRNVIPNEENVKYDKVYLVWINFYL